MAEDIVQEVFLQIWLNRTRLDPTKNIKSYLYIATRNRALNVLRRASVEREHQDKITYIDSRVLTPEDELERHQTIQETHRTIDQLPEKCRIIFTMSRFDYLTYAEIAEILDISIKTVETQMGRALKSLRHSLAHLINF